MVKSLQGTTRPQCGICLSSDCICSEALFAIASLVPEVKLGTKKPSGTESCLGLGSLVCIQWFHSGDSKAFVSRMEREAILGESPSPLGFHQIPQRVRGLSKADLGGHWSCRGMKLMKNPCPHSACRTLNHLSNTIGYCLQMVKQLD